MHRLVETSEGVTEYRLGVGDYDELTPRKFMATVRTVVQSAQKHEIEHVALELSPSSFPKLTDYDEAWFFSTLAENLLIGAYEYDTYQTPDPDEPKKTLKEVVVCGNVNKEAKAGFLRGKTVADYVNKARDIANTPGDDMAPFQLANAAQKLAKGTGVKVTVLDEKRIQKEGLEAVWAVGKGARDLPRFIIMEYYGAGKPQKGKKDTEPIALVGKGITYDTGGLNVKPSGQMHEMHLDMSGGSAVIAAICAAGKLKLKKNVVAVIPAAENAVSDRSMRAGDIIGSHAGKTIEVIHTDAEGRLVLADGLSYVKKFTPRATLDVATLTGAALVALGQHASAVLTEDKQLRTTLEELGEESGDYVWPLPLWEEYKELVKSKRADVANIEPTFSRFAGTIEGGIFLSHFAPDCPWAHIDIAPRMVAAKHDKLAHGSTGEPVRLLIKFIENY